MTSHRPSLLKPTQATPPQLPPGYVASPAGATLVEAAAAAIADSFHDLDSCRWLIPDPVERRALFPPYLGMLTEHALTHGHLHVITHTPQGNDAGEGQGGEEPGARPGGGNRAGATLGEPAPEAGPVTPVEVVAAAVWLRAPFPPVPDYEQRLSSICGQWAGRFRVLDTAMQAAHPSAAQHAYLAYLAVTPTHQSRGLGSFLLAQHLQQVDAAGQAAYLEASNNRSAALYARHGFVFLGAPIRLPDDVEPIYPMERPPAPPLAEPAAESQPGNRPAPAEAASPAASQETASR